MKKAIDQTVRDLKRGVNKKVLKVPLIEQKVLDATSNEPWGPHGTLLADIAQASRNSFEYQMIMSIIWKRINDTGKNWRHVYKALTVLDYLVGHGSERVIEEIREHAYQIQTLADFQYIDSSGRDQGNNVRRKSQNLVVLVNDKERILEVRQKAAANRDKFQNSSAGSMYRPRSRERFDDRSGSRDEERNGYGKEREYRYRDDDRYGKYGDSNSRDGDRYGREYEDRDRYGRDDDYRRRSPSVDGSQYGSRSRSADRDRERGYEDDGQYSSRGRSGARADDQSQDGSASGGKLNRIYSEQNLSAPPNYEDAVGSAHSSTHSDRDGETSAAAHKSSIPSASSSPPQATGTAASSPARAPSSSAAPAVNNKEPGEFNEFDPRGTVPTAPTTSSTVAPTRSNNGEVDLFASLSDSFTDNSLALVPTNEVEASTNSASGVPSQGHDDPFGDGQFKAIPSTDGAPGQQQSFHSVPSFQNTPNSGPQPPQQTSQSSAMVAFSGATSTSSGDTNIDMLADIFPVSGHQHPVNSQPDYPATVNQEVPQSGQIVPSTFSSSGDPQAHQTGFPAQSGQTAFYGGGPTAHQTSFPVQSGHPSSIHGFPPQSGQPVMHPNYSSQFGQPARQEFFPVHNGQPSSGYPNQPVHPNAASYGNYNMQPGGQNMVPEVSSAPTSQQNATNFHESPQPFQAPQTGSSALVASQSGFPSSASISTAPPPKDKFETKSSVWTDTLNRGLVNLNISGPKTNPLSDIGVDFDALNRKEKRMEKPAANPVTSTIHMGKAMGSGSGIGRAGAGGLRPTSNPMMGAGAGMGMAGPRPYGGMNQQSMGMGMGSNMGPNTAMAPNMGMGAQMQRPTGFPPGATMQGGYNPMMGTGNYGQNPYGGGYR